MSKNLTRKGLAFGAGIALVASGFAAVPAQADTTGPITLVPNAGTTFNSILQSGITLKSEIDPTVGANEAGSLSFLIENPAGSDIGAVFDTAGSLNFVLANETDVAPTTTAFATEYTNAKRLDATSRATRVAGNTLATTNKFLYVTGAAAFATGTTNYVDFAAAIAGGAGAYNFGTTSAANTLVLTTLETTKNVTLHVTSWLDANGNGLVDTFEKSSDRETIILYTAANAAATTTLNSAVVGTDTFKSTVVYGNDINPYAVKARTVTQLLRNGVVVDITANTTSDLLPTDIGATSFGGSAGYTKNTLVSGVTVGDGNFMATQLAAVAGTGIYLALSFYETTVTPNLNVMTGKVRIGAPSQILDLSAGSNAVVDKMALEVTDTANFLRTATDANEIYVRTGTTSVTFGVQVREATAVLKAANIGIRAIVSETALDAAAEITITGATGKLVKNGASVMALGVTNSNGQASFTVTSKNGKKDDAIDVVLQFKNAAGVWTTINDQANGGVNGGLDIKWFDTAFSAFTPKPAAFVSGANPVVTFEVTDQWSQPVSFIDDTRLSVYASAYVGGVESTTRFAERVTVVNGVAAFTFANFATAGATAELRGILFKGATSNIATSNVTVYNTAETSAITVANSFKTNITYNDYVTGSSTNPTVAAALVATGLGADTVRATIAGNVNNTTGSGQPGAAVTLSAAGVLFFDQAAKVYALDTITTTSNEFGAWTVFAYSHTVNAKGVDVSITSGTVTKSTKLITHLPANLLDRNNLVFSFDVPATLVMNTTYVVIAKLADKWGNPIQTAGATGSVSVVGNGSVQVNGVTAATVKDFNAKGEATVFVRSIKDIAGPSSVTATLLAVADQYAIDPAVTENGTLGSDTFGTLASTTVDVTGTAWNETLFERTIAVERDVVTTAPAVVSTQKVNAGSFKGFVALYALGYEGQRMSAKVGNDWIVVPAIPKSTNDLFRAVDFVGAGVEISVRIYIDRVLLATIPLLTK